MIVNDKKKKIDLQRNAGWFSSHVDEFGYSFEFFFVEILQQKWGGGNNSSSVCLEHVEAPLAIGSKAEKIKRKGKGREGRGESESL